ncbi:MAG TPA: hypothetical protein VHS78_06875 [Candidatus Elarobacter sp.]|nr:hypothetical protein [Candidatus Elarobacter sp.]
MGTPQTGIATSAPVLVSTCAVTDLYNPATNPEFGSNISYRTLQLTFWNTDESVATLVTFDVTHDGTHTKVIDRGRFTRGVPIEHTFGDFNGTYGGGDAQCAVTAVAFADGHQWTAPAGTAAMPAQRDPRADRAFHPDYSKALTADEMNGAWQNELDRINPPIVTGGG